VLLFEVSAYTGFFGFSWDASIASLTDAAPDLAAFVMLKKPVGAMMTCCITTHPGVPLCYKTHTTIVTYCKRITPA